MNSLTDSLIDKLLFELHDHFIKVTKATFGGLENKMNRPEEGLHN